MTKWSFVKVANALDSAGVDTYNLRNQQRNFTTAGRALTPNLAYVTAVRCLEAAIAPFGKWLAEKEEHKCNLSWLLWNSDVAVIQISRKRSDDTICGCQVVVESTSRNDAIRTESLSAFEKEQVKVAGSIKPLSELLYAETRDKFTGNFSKFHIYPLNHYYTHGMSYDDKMGDITTRTYLIPVGGDHATRHPHIARRVTEAADAVASYQKVIQTTDVNWHDYSNVAAVNAAYESSKTFIRTSLIMAARALRKTSDYQDIVSMFRKTLDENMLDPDRVESEPKSLLGVKSSRAVLTTLSEHLSESDSIILTLGLTPPAFWGEFITDIPKWAS